MVKTDDRFEILGKSEMGLVCFRLKGANYYTQLLLRAINLSGKLHMVPALIRDDYVIRFAICAENANEDDINFAWNVIKEIAHDVIQGCRDEPLNIDLEKRLKLEIEHKSRKESNEEHVSASDDEFFNSDFNDDQFLNDVMKDVDDVNSLAEVFPFDDNIVSMPSIKSLDDAAQLSKIPSYKHRNILLRMISEPKMYNPKVFKSLSIERKNRMESGMTSAECSPTQMKHSPS